MIHDGILTAVQAALQLALIDNISASDPAQAGVVYLGDLQGNPDPDVGRISVTLHENDPDRFISGAVTGMTDDWSDEVEMVEIGGATTWQRKFTVKARCLLEGTKEDLGDTRDIASTVRSRIEQALYDISFSTVSYNGEYVSRGIVSEALKGEMLQSGGPPDSYDYFIKFRFDVLTTKP
jgi:hypothetical protein